VSKNAIKTGGIVPVSTYPYLIPALSSKGEKYVRSEPDDSANDNLLQLPRV